MTGPKAVRKRIAYTLLVLTPGLLASNVVVARWSADFFPPNALAFWRWLIALSEVFLSTGTQMLFQQRQRHRHLLLV